MAGGWRVGFRRVVAGRVEVGLLVLTAPAVLVPGRPTAPGRETWTAVAAAAVVYLRVVAGATVVAVVVVTVVVKSLGIQSGTQQNAGGGWCFATLSGGRESRSDFWGEMSAKKLTLRLPHTQKKALPPWHGDSHAPRQSCVPGAAIRLSFLEKSAFQVYQHEIVRASLAIPSRVPVRAHFPGPWAVSHRHVPCAVEERSNFTPRYGLPELRTSPGTRTNL